MRIDKYISPQLFNRFFKFGAVGSWGIVVNQTLLWFLTDKCKIDYRFSSIGAIECAIISNFVLNSLWTWKDRPVHRIRNIAIRFIKFNTLTGVTSFIFNWLILIALKEIFHIHYLIANLIGIGLAMCINFAVNHFWTFSKGKTVEIPRKSQA